VPFILVLVCMLLTILRTALVCLCLGLVLRIGVFVLRLGA